MEKTIRRTFAIISAIFHSFFHRCGKLWEETKRACAWGTREIDLKDADCNTNRLD